MGSYAESLLTQGEKIIMRQRQHWLSLLLDSRLAILLWGFTILFVILRVFAFRDGALSDTANLVVVLTLIGGIAVVAIRWWVWRTQEYLVTNRRLLNTSGVVNKRTADSSLEKINDAILEVNLMGRILNYGDLEILTASDTGVDRYRMLNHATEFKKAMMTAKHALQGSERGDGDDYSPSTTAPPASSPAKAATPAPIDLSGGQDPLKADTPEEVAAVLAQLTQLRDAGHITSGEYEIKKQELLGRL